jgi:hypothetical protein
VEREKMAAKSSVFERTYQDYIAQVADIDLKSVEEKLCVKVEENKAVVPIFGQPYLISEKGIVDPSGMRPSLDICVILFKYILMCPDIRPKEKEWVAFRNLKDSGPLTSYFLNDVEQAIAVSFSGRLAELLKASNALGGYAPEMELSYELAMQFDPLPRIPLLMLFNDSDQEFPATCSVLFEKRSERYLDPECLAMVGRLLFTCLITDQRKSVE